MSNRTPSALHWLKAFDWEGGEVACMNRVNFSSEVLTRKNAKDAGVGTRSLENSAHLDDFRGEGVVNDTIKGESTMCCFRAWIKLGEHAAGRKKGKQERKKVRIRLDGSGFRRKGKKTSF